MKIVDLQYGKESLKLNVPQSCDVLSAGECKPLLDTSEAVRLSLSKPINSAPLHKIAKGKKTAAVIVSDNTRPVPYKEPDGILSPVIKILKQSGVDRIKIIVACGTHRAMQETELRDMLGIAAFEDGVEVINHIATDQSMLKTIGSTNRTACVSINTHYLNADLKIATGLVEPHFMAGVSGGAKAICPGISGLDVTYGFHSASILNHKKAASMVIKGNPCCEESRKIAEMAGIDFIVNVTLNSDKKITGVFSGQLQKAHTAAIEHLKTYVSIPLNHLYDIVITQAGEVGVNHYQCAKAAVEASRAVKRGGKIIMAGDLSDPDPVGNQNYKQTQKLLAESGPKAFLEKILSDDWTFIPEQWQSQMWIKVFMHLQDAKNLFTCAPRLRTISDDLIPEVNVAAQAQRTKGQSDKDFAQKMMQQTIDMCIEKNSPENIAVLPDGPYAVPVLKNKS